MESKEKENSKKIAEKPALYESENEEKLNPQANLPTPENTEVGAAEKPKPRRGRPANNGANKNIVASKSSDASPAGKRTYKKRNIDTVTLNEKSKSVKTETAAEKNSENKNSGVPENNILLESSMNKANLEIQNLQKVHSELRKNVLKLEKKIKLQKSKNKKESSKEKEKIKKEKKKSEQKLKNAESKLKKAKSKKKK